MDFISKFNLFSNISSAVGAKSNPLPTLLHNFSRVARSYIMNGISCCCNVNAVNKPHGPPPAIITGNCCCFA